MTEIHFDFTTLIHVGHQLSKFVIDSQKAFGVIYYEEFRECLLT